MGQSAETAVNAGDFKFEFFGQELQCESVFPGAMTMKEEDVTPADRPDNYKRFTGSQAKFEDWTFTRNCYLGDNFVKNIFWEFATGAKDFDAASQATLSYLDATKTNVVRACTAYGLTPLTYDCVQLDSKDGSGQMQETMTFKVNRVVYE
jgi:hypothetical protein